MKILDRYISSSIAAAFLSGVMVFMSLLCAMDLFKRFIVFVTTYHIHPSIALIIIAYKLPITLMYAFPMAVLLGILLVFSRMSAESEMVAIRAGGVSFLRITAPVLVFALCMTGLTFLISNYFAPYASEKSADMERIAKKEAKTDLITYAREDATTGKLLYSILAGKLEVDGENGVMSNVTVTYYTAGIPQIIVSAPRAIWDLTRGCWQFEEEKIDYLGGDAESLSIRAARGSTFLTESPAFQVKDSPFRLSKQTTDPGDMRSDDIRRQIAEMRASKDDSPRKIGPYVTRLAQRYSTPFACLVFAMIGAPLGLRHHRASSAVGFGISLLVIFAFYFVNVYVSSFGDSGSIPPIIAAWGPLALGAVLGIILLFRANR